MSKPQSAESHAKMVPAYHYVAFSFLFVPTVYFAAQAVRNFSVAALMTVVFSAGVILATLYARVFPLGVQDRVIRLEERLRLHRVLPAEMHDRIESIPTSLLIGLRFAPDDELEGLVSGIYAGELTDRKAVKASVKTWRPDYQRI